MTSVCGTCKAEVGEKCPHPLCNGAAAYPKTGLIPEVFECGFCHRTFSKGEGGVTTTYCQPCFEKEMNSIPTWAANQPKENQ